MTQKAGAATVTADYSQAKLQAETDKALYDLGVISGLAYKASKGKADELTTRNNMEDQRLDINQKAIESQMAQQQAKVDQMRALGGIEAEATGSAKSSRRNRWRAGGSANASRTTRIARSDAGESRPAGSSDGRVEDR